MSAEQPESESGGPPAAEKQESAAPPEVGPRRPFKKIILIGGLVLARLKGVPWVWHSLRTESTDDAYVNIYVTFVAPRVAGQVAQVLVEDNNRVKKGDVLVE